MEALESQAFVAAAVGSPAGVSVTPGVEGPSISRSPQAERTSSRAIAESRPEPERG